MTSTRFGEALSAEQMVRYGEAKAMGASDEIAHWYGAGMMKRCSGGEHWITPSSTLYARLALAGEKVGWDNGNKQCFYCQMSKTFGRGV